MSEVEVKEVEGIKEIKEVIEAVKKLSVDVIVGMKDGISFDDISILTSNLDVIKTAIEGYDKLDDEVKDISLSELKELVILGVDLVSSIIEATKDELPKAVVE